MARVLGLALFFYASVASAFFNYVWGDEGSPTIAAHCAYRIAAGYTKCELIGETRVTATGFAQGIQVWYPGGGASYSIYTRKIGCPAQSQTAADGSCSCNPGLSESVSEYVTSCTRVCEKGVKKNFQLPYPGSAGSACAGGCDFVVLQASNQYADRVTGKQVIFGQYIGTGQMCAADNATVSTPDSVMVCPAGKVPGTVNGLAVCVPSSASAPASGTDKNTQTVTNTGADGSTTGTTTKDTTTETQCDGTSCQTTTTTTTIIRDGSGSITEQKTDTVKKTAAQSDKTKPDTITQFCSDNPTSPICKVSSINAAACAAFNCDGDAVQCQIAREQWQRNCTLYEQTSLSQLGDALASGSDPLLAQMPWAKETTTAFADRINNTSTWGSSGTCGITDIRFSFRGEEMVWPASNWCSPLLLLGQVMVAVSLIIAARITFGGG